MILRAEGQAARNRGAERAPLTLGSFWLSLAGSMDREHKAHRMGISSASALWAALFLIPFQTSGPGLGWQGGWESRWDASLAQQKG